MTRVDSALTAPGARHRDGIVAEVGQAQILEQETAVGVRVGAHAALALGGEGGQLGLERAVGVKELLRPVALHPVFEDLDVVGVLMHLPHRHLVGAPVALGPLAIDLLRAGPALGRAQHDHRPARPLREAVVAARRPGCAGCQR